MAEVDVVVVGAGPAGSAAAICAARAGKSVVLLERGPFPGSKNMYGGVIYGRILDGLIPRWWEEAPIQRWVTRRSTMITTGTQALTIDYRTEAWGEAPYNGATAYRPDFDNWLAQHAVEAGAQLVCSTTATGLLRDGDRVVGIRTDRPDGDLTAEVVIACDGVNSFLAKEAGLYTHTDPGDYTLGVKETLALPREVIDERFGVRGLHGFLVVQYVDDARFLTPVPDALLDVGVLTEPMSVVEKGLSQAWTIQRRLGVWRPARALVVGAGTIGLLTTLALRLRGLDVTCIARSQAPTANSVLVEATGARYVSTRERGIATIAAQDGLFDLVLEASGAADLIPPSAMALAPNGVLVLASVTGGSTVVPVDLAAWNQAFVLWNRAMVGTVNSAPVDWRNGVVTLAQARTVLPGWTERLLTTRIEGLDPDAISRHLKDPGRSIKTVVHIAEPAPAA